MNQSIDSNNLLFLAWNYIRPYVMEAPELLNTEYNWLKKTTLISKTLTSPELLFDYFCNASTDESVNSQNNYGISSRITKTNAFKKVSSQRQLTELIDVSNIFNCFLYIFSNRDSQIKENYKIILEDYYFNYKMIKFYHVTTHDLVFDGFDDLVKFFDNLCGEFKFNVVITKELTEYVCMLMASVVSRYYGLNHILTPSYAYKGLLPLYAVHNEMTGYTNLVLSITINRCFFSIPQEFFSEEETPCYFNFILHKIIDSLSGSILGYLQLSSIFNSDITGLDQTSPAKNVCSLTKAFMLGANKIQIYSYDKSIEEFIAVITKENHYTHYVYITPGLCADNAAPLSLTLLNMFAITSDMTIRPLNASEEKTIEKIASDLKMIIT